MALGEILRTFLRFPIAVELFTRAARNTRVQVQFHPHPKTTDIQPSFPDRLEGKAQR